MGPLPSLLDASYDEKNQIFTLGNEHVQIRINLQEKIGEGTFSNVFFCISEIKPKYSPFKSALKIVADPRHSQAATYLLREHQVVHFLKDHSISPRSLKEKSWAVFRFKNLTCLWEKLYIGDLFDNLEIFNACPLLKRIHALYKIIYTIYQCHACSIFGFDIKPLNILIDEEGELVLSDLGGCTHQDELGTKSCVAPPPLYCIATKGFFSVTDWKKAEKASEKKDWKKVFTLGCQRDVYALGKSLLILFEESSDMPDQIYPLIGRMCDENPEKRPHIITVRHLFAKVTFDLFLLAKKQSRR